MLSLLQFCILFQATRSEFLLLKIQDLPAQQEIQLETESQTTLEDCKCGQQLTSQAPWTRIVGGAFVDFPHKYPWQVAILVKKFPHSPKSKWSLYCGGSIIGKN